MLHNDRTQTEESTARVIARSRLCPHRHLKVLTVMASNAVEVGEIRIGIQILEVLHRLHVATTRAFESPPPGAFTEPAHSLVLPCCERKGFTLPSISSSSLHLFTSHLKSSRVDLLQVPTGMHTLSYTAVKTATTAARYSHNSHKKLKRSSDRVPDRITCSRAEYD